jgi:cytoskeletal protein RodZ
VRHFRSGIFSHYAISFELGLVVLIMSYAHMSNMFIYSIYDDDAKAAADSTTAPISSSSSSSSSATSSATNTAASRQSTQASACRTSIQQMFEIQNAGGMARPVLSAATASSSAAANTTGFTAANFRVEHRNQPVFEAETQCVARTCTRVTSGLLMCALLPIAVRDDRGAKVWFLPLRV